MSGWENLPDEKFPPPPSAVAASEVASDSAEMAPPATEFVPVEDGDLIRAAEWYFPALWIGMLAVVAFIGIYSAVSKLPNSPW